MKSIMKNQQWKSTALNGSFITRFALNRKIYKIWHRNIVTQTNIIMVWYAFFSLSLSKLTQNKDRPFFVRNFYGYFSHQHCYHSCCFFLMQLEVRVKISKRSSAKKRSTDVTFWFKMASSLRLVYVGSPSSFIFLVNLS